MFPFVIAQAFQCAKGRSYDFAGAMLLIQLGSDARWPSGNNDGLSVCRRNEKRDFLTLAALAIVTRFTTAAICYLARM